MATVEAGTVDVFVLARDGAEWRALVLQRANDTRCPTAWETVHGHIEAGEEPEQAAVRELREETGLTAERLYSVRVQPIYLVRTHTVHLGVGFAAIVSRHDAITLGAEHMAHAWLPVEQAMARYAWPAERAGLRECLELLGTGDAGPLEDVLRVF
ncbi:MAG: hydrolase [Gemmatimonadetes bacterium]|jgi:dATP pyrophosphohydrolase|nr:hydrolase [Gemmatimonadota bacterium]